MNLLKAETLALELIKQHGLTDWQFKFDYAVRRAGACHFHTKTITLSSYVTEKREEEFVKDTILHEIAHALCPPGEHHGKIWKAKALEIGCNGERCYTDIKVEGKYKATCINGHVSYLNRKSKRKHSCGQCSNQFDERFLLDFKPTENEQ